MKTEKRISSRCIVYIVITWLLVGIVIVYGACFTVLNGFSHLSFSKDNNDLYQVDGKWLSNGGYYEGIYYLPFLVDLEHDAVHYMRLVVSGLDEDEVTMSLEVHTEEGEDAVIVSDAPLTNGVNFIEIPRKDFSEVILYIYGTDSVNVEEIQFRETNEDISVSDVLPCIFVTTILYVALSAAFVFIMQKVRKRRRSGQ